MKEIRIYNDLTQRELASILNVSRSTYAGYENGIDWIPLKKLNLFCNFFNLSLDYVCGLTTNKICNTEKDDINNNIVANNLKTIRKNHKHTQKFVADKLKTTRSNYSNYEQGISLILTFYIIDFAKLYNVSIDFICGKSKEMQIKK